MSSAASSVTPVMRQYMDAKRQHRDAILFFRMGDFYEMFYEDALVAARALDLTLTSRSKDAGGAGIPMCGVPFHAVDGYLAKLVGKGFRVAMCEQVEDPRKAKGLVKREVVRVVSPGTLTDAKYLEAREPAYLMAIVASPADLSREARPAQTAPRTPRAPEANGEARDEERETPGGAGSPRRSRRGEEVFGVALIDITTGEFSTAEYRNEAGRQALSDEIAVLRPREIVLPAESGLAERLTEIARLQVPVSTLEGWNFEPEFARRTLLEQLRVHGLDGFGLEGRTAAVQAAGGLVSYLRATQQADLAHVRTITLKTSADCLIVDPVTLKHLEIIAGSDGSPKGSLLHEIDRTVTVMGGRLLRGWLLRPLCALERIRDRLDAVEEFAFRSTDRAKLREALKAVHDLERLVARAALGAAGPRDLVALGQSLTVVPRVRTVLGELQAPLTRSLVAELDDLAELRHEIERTLIAEPPVFARDGGFTRDGVDAELDELTTISRSGRQVIADMEEVERGRTGISSLKVRFNRVFGYYIEISKSNLHAVPPDYQRKQTVAGGERFTTAALKEYETKVLGADERILERELEIFERLRARVGAEAPRIQDTARALAALDVLSALAETAAVSNYTKPHVHEGDEMIVADARHPVVEQMAAAFVPNDVDLDGSTRQLVVLTGPNMGGKSTYLRQTALLPILAQTGSFVPAKEAKLPIVDRIFARVGASDNIARGQSTFMVEMQETANILQTATSRSLVVLDEIGRGTSTFDGLSIAWAVAEYLASNARARPKTLFATHYHELTDLADSLPGVVNAHVAAREWQDDIVFLRKILPGRSDRSYGIQVARLAGLPASVISRAREILKGLERDELSRGGRPTLSGAAGDPQNTQLGLFVQPTDRAEAEGERQSADVSESADQVIAKRLQATDLDDITPRRALELLAELKQLAEER